MKTYAENQHYQPFDWRLALSRLYISQKEWELLDDLANSWVTCACGNLCDAIPRALDGAPLDAELRSLGLTFMNNIEYQDSKLALETLDKIEKRSSAILTEIWYKKDNQ